MTDPLVQLLFILVAWVVCQATRDRGAALVLTLSGAAFVAIHAPVAALVILVSSVEAMLMVLAWRRLDRQSAWRKYGAYLIFLNLFFVDFHPLVLGLNVETLAISFALVRIFMTAKQLLVSRGAIARNDVGWIAVAAFFLPAIVVGPVFSGLDLRDAKRGEVMAAVTTRDYRMILGGLVLAILVNPALGSAVDWVGGDHGLAAPAFAAAPLLFVQLFAAFWGQSLIAEHTSRFFGFTLPQNFDQPWLAKTVPDFWSRWHRSMAQFVMQYIFLPLNLRGVSPRLATVAAFTFMGLWHNVSAGYLIWGVAHGAMMASWPKRAFGGAVAACLRLLTWIAIISLSYIANYGALA
jgi:D-alanyl-lipoteichoic acid acyltransferase DltB (MBOAT superfamily)